MLQVGMMMSVAFLSVIQGVVMLNVLAPFFLPPPTPSTTDDGRQNDVFFFSRHFPSDGLMPVFLIKPDPKYWS
jgi:hypothetical protein